MGVKQLPDTQGQARQSHFSTPYHAVKSTTKLEQMENILTGLWITVD
jgi:hypothetical protein